MISSESFYKKLEEVGVNFYTGVPDSLLKNFCFFVEDNLPPSQHIITANEGQAIGLASGYYMATGKIPVVYMQNSGLGNAVNPLLSIADKEVYGIPMLLIIGWRGEPNKKDEPQHVKQGRVMLDMLNSMEMPFEVIDQETDFQAAIDKAMNVLNNEKRPFVFAVKDGTFSDYKLRKETTASYSLSRERALDCLLNVTTSKDVVICTTGKASRELYELRESRSEGGRADFLTVGAMGHCSQIALGVALQSLDRKVFCFDGDGSLLMHMGTLATIGKLSPRNYIHILINNGAHESVGGQETGAFQVDWAKIASSCGYKHTFYAEEEDELCRIAKKLKEVEGPILFEIRTRQGSRSNLGRPKTTPLQNKEQFMKALNG